jgi:hypothetical protein
MAAHASDPDYGIRELERRAAESGRAFVEDLAAIVRHKKEAASKAEDLLSATEAIVKCLTRSRPSETVVEPIGTNINRPDTAVRSLSGVVPDDELKQVLDAARSDSSRIAIIVESYKGEWVSIDAVLKTLLRFGYKKFDSEIGRRVVSSDLHKHVKRQKLERGRRGLYRAPAWHPVPLAAREAA